MKPFEEATGIKSQIPDCLGEIRNEYSERCNGLCDYAALCVTQDWGFQNLLTAMRARGR